MKINKKFKATLVKAPIKAILGLMLWSAFSSQISIVPIARADAVSNSFDVCKYFDFLNVRCADNADGGQDIYDLMTNIVNFILSIAASVALAMMVYAGFLLIFSSADPDKAQDAKKIITWAIVGLIIIMTAFIITTGIKEFIYQGVALSE